MTTPIDVGIRNVSEIVIRDVSDIDVPAIQEIYAHHVRHGLVSWEETPPDVAEITRRRNAIISDGYPYRVAVSGSRVVGYTYAGKYRPRPAYRHTVENSIYVDEQMTGVGVGQQLLDDLIAICTTMGLRCMVGIIGDSANHASIALHEKAGFKMVGIIPSCGFKAGRWLDQVIMQRPLGPVETTLPNS
jgi:L-amino acid N-acyltransferase YncA